MSLSSLFVQREIATIRQVEEALARQVIYGGDLVTNLLEVARVDEAVVTEMLAESFGLSPAPIGELPPPTDRARAMVPPEMAAERAMVPLDVEGDRLVLAVAERIPSDVEEELTFALGLPIEQRVAPMVRIRQALNATFGYALERRYERLVARLGGAPSATSASMPPLFTNPPQVVEPPKMPSRPPAARKQEEPARTPLFGTPVVPPPSPVPGHRVTSAGFPAVPGEVESSPHAPPVTVPPPAAFAAPDPSAASTAPPSVEPGPNTPVVPAGRSVSGRPSLLNRDVVHASRPPRRRRGPVTLDDAKKAVEEAADRDALLDLFFDFARQFFDYSAIFIVHGDIAEGRDAWGAGASRERVVGIGVPLDLPSLLATAKERRGPLTAAPATDGLDAVLLADLQRTTRAKVLVVPIVVRTRAVALFLGDCGELGVDASTANEVATFAAAVGHGFERIIVRRKLHGFIAGSTSSNVGRVDARMVDSKAKRRSSTPRVPRVAPPHPPAPRIDTPAIGPGASEAPAPEALELHDDLGLAPAPSPSAPAVAPHSPVPPIAPSTSVPPISRGRIAEPISPRPAPPPPAANVTVVRKLSGPPIPREEPDSARARRLRSVEIPGDVPAPSPLLFADATPVDPADSPAPPDVAQTLPDAAYAMPAHEKTPSAPPSGQPSSGPILAVDAVDDDTARALLDEIGTAHPSDRPPGGYESQSVVVAPHRPPSSRAFVVEKLPSVIVDTDTELGVLVDRILTAGIDDEAESELLRQGQHAMPPIMARFPGPVAIERGRLSDVPPRVTECGPLLRLIAGQRKVALPFVLERLNDSDAEKRYWATFLLTELPYAEAAAPAVARLFDDEARTRRAARLALTAIAKAAPQVVVDEVAKLALGESDARREGAIAVLGELREPLGVAPLVKILEERVETVAEPARRALVAITRQDFGTDARRWASWWTANATRHRIEWLIDALSHDVSEIRRAAGEELKALTKEYFGFSDDLPPRERERAQQRYRDWWVTEGRGRFRRR